jgi:hypothetical protein
MIRSVSTPGSVHDGLRSKAILRSLDIPMLAVFGGKEIQVVATQSAPAPEILGRR